MIGFSFVTLKAFGDYVIAYSSLRSYMEGSSHVVGSHLRALALAINPEWHPVFLEHQEASVPAAFDVKKRGLRAAASSTLELRKAISRLPEGRVLVFDRWTWREKLLAAQRPAMCLPPAANIYLAYQEFFKSQNLRLAFAQSPRLVARAPRGSKVRIFAGSRLEKKKIPLALCEQLISALAQRGEEAEVVALENEYPALEAAPLPKLILPHSFTGMVNCVAESKLVISADSLPAHIAEIYGLKPVVVSPIDNSYWLPRSSFDSGAWSLFDQRAPGILDAIDKTGG